LFTLAAWKNQGWAYKTIVDALATKDIRVEQFHFFQELRAAFSRMPSIAPSDWIERK
jgi:hypothetical protein